MNMIENLGFDFVMESEESYMGFLAKVCEDGKAITGYYGYPYFNLEYGDSQFVARTQMTEEEKLEVVGMDTHVPGRAVWEVLLSDINVQPKDADPLSRRVIVKRVSDGGGMAVVNLINADVLPSFLENEKVQMQMIAFPEVIHYYADEEAYEADQPENANGKKWLLADGSMLATGLLSNHGVDDPDNDKDHYSDNYMLIHGTVKGFVPSVIKIGDQEIKSYIRTRIATEHGDLEIVHTIDQVDESEHDNLRAGAVVNGLFILSGDVAIYEYANGIVRDEEHNLSLLRYILQEGDPKRMQAVLKDSSVYVSEASGKEWVGAKEIIGRLQFVREANPERDYFAHLATITGVDDGGEELAYGVGQRCVILAEEKADNYVSIGFLDMDEEGYITKLTISVNSRYHFKIDEPVRPKSVFDDFKIPESVAEPMLARARYHGFLDHKTDDEAVLGRLENVKTYESNAQRLFVRFEEHPEVEAEEKYTNAFGYLFAKSIESDHSWRHGDREQFRLVVSYSSADAFTGALHTHLQPALEEKVKIAYDYGKQFYKDLKIFCAMHEECSFEEELFKAAVIVQQIGEAYSQTILDKMPEGE
ncbi:MAG: hypothetical protein J6J43_02235 [Oscillospiraceae bacterium]|nr:hypothetical protein [Oscillospiraceae bacterium]